jgi:hypothetical protein
LADKLKKTISVAGGEKGSVILLAIFLMFFISALMITVEMLRLSDTEDITNQIEDMQAYYCAEAGIEFTIWRSRNSQFNAAAAWYPSVSALANTTTGPFACTDNGGVPGWWVNTGWTFTITVQNSKPDPARGYYHYYSVTSSGATGTFTRRVRADIRRPESPENNCEPGVDCRSYQQIRRWREL